MARVLTKEDMIKLVMDARMQEIEQEVIRKERTDKRQEQKQELINLKNYCLSYKKEKEDNIDTIKCM